MLYITISKIKGKISVPIRRGTRREPKLRADGALLRGDNDTCCPHKAGVSPVSEVGWTSQRIERRALHQPPGPGLPRAAFVRERKYDKLGTQPFYFLGPVSYVDHRGEKPVSFTWRLPQQMPEALFEVARSVAAA